MMSERWKQLFSIDLRAMALMRIGLALVLVFDLLFRIYNVDALYGTNGILPMDYVLQHMGIRPPLWRLYFVSDAAWLPLALLCLNLLSAVLLLLGAYTRVTLLVCWFLFGSLYYRNGLVHSGAEATLLMGLFWAFFLPCGAYLSFDRWRKKTTPLAVIHYSPVTVAFTCQIVAYYLLSGLHKSGSAWWPEGTALYYALNLETLSSGRATFLLQVPWLMQGMSFAVWIAEVCSPFLLVVLPALLGLWLRSATVLFLIAFHIGIALFMDIGTFPYINLAILLAFLPSHFYEAMFKFGSAVPTSDIGTCMKNMFTVQVTNSTEKYWSEKSIATSIFIGLTLSLIVAQGYYSYTKRTAPVAIYKIARSMAMRQSFRFFSPQPSRQELYWFFPGTLADGTEVDVFNLALTPSPIEKQYAGRYYNKVWRKYFLRFTKGRQSQKPLKTEFARYLCDRWYQNFANSGYKNLEEVRLVYLLEITQVPGSSRPPFTHKSRGDSFQCANLSAPSTDKA